MQAGLFWLYYQPVLPAVAMLWMWAAAVRFFESRAIKYDVCFSARDQLHLLPSRSILHVIICWRLPNYPHSPSAPDLHLPPHSPTYPLMEVQPLYPIFQYSQV